MTWKCCIVIFLVLFFLASPVRVLGSTEKSELSPEQAALAKKLGVNPNPLIPQFRYRSVADQTWLSPWVVEGTVERIDEDLYGPYHTKVRVKALRYLKGAGPHEITLNVLDGRFYSEYDKKIMRVDTVGSLTFSSGDVDGRFILFLDKHALSPRGRETHYEHGEGEFRTANRYRVVDDHAEPDPGIAEAGSPGAKRYSYQEIVAEILRVAVPQSQISKGTP